MAACGVERGWQQTADLKFVIVFPKESKNKSEKIKKLQ